MRSVGRSKETYRDWRKNDAQFRASVDRVREQLRTGVVADTAVPDFPEFCERYLKPLPLHHLRAWDVLCGREPRDWHDSMKLVWGSVDTEGTTKSIIINFPPDHAKSTVWNVQYAIWSICKNPDVRIAIVSKTREMAMKFLSQIKFVLGNPQLFPDLHAAFSPDGGWKSDDKADGLSWRQNLIYVKGREQAEKDPTVEALGIGGHIYGARFDKIILDDIEDFSSAGMYETHADLIGQDIYSRLDKSHGELIILGTRVGVMDIYRWLRDEATDEDGEASYTYFAQPAILENEHSHSDEWKVLWPERLSAKMIAKAKAKMTDKRRFAFVYQQSDVPDEATFPAEAIQGSVNRQRYHGPMQGHVPGHRDKGMDGLYVIASWDPASSAGRNAFIVYAVDRETKHRFVLDVWIKKGAVPRETIQLLKDWTMKYNVREWRIEKNAVQQFITQLPEIRDFLTGHGCILREHQTTANKWDANMGVEGTLVPLFLSCVDDVSGRLVQRKQGAGLISLPSPAKNKHVAELMSHLSAWEPNNPKLVQDGVMALWFAELAAIRYLRAGQQGNGHVNQSKYTTRRSMAARGQRARWAA